jgi:interferon gamma-inducible protein 30
MEMPSEALVGRSLANTALLNARVFQFFHVRLLLTALLGNLNLNCLVHEAGNQTSIYWPAWACIEGSEDPIKDAANCVTQAGISWLKVSSCASGALGKALVNAAADATEALSPPHKFVPWVTVNGAPLGENDLPNLVSIVCKAYQGQTKPAICNN